MKKILPLFILLYLGISQTKAQNYHKFLNNSSWCESSNPLFGLPIDYFVYKQSNDTIINGLTYAKILVTGGGATFYVREDTVAKKVFILDNHITTEVILYDFSLNIGDTLPAKHGWGAGNKLVVRSINMINTFGGQRRSFYLSDSSGNFNYTTIESIGCPLDPFLNDYAVGDPVSALVCSYQNNIQIYNGTNGYPCYNYTNIPCNANFTYSYGLNGQVTFTNIYPEYSSHWTSWVGINHIDSTVFNTPSVTFNFPCNGTYSIQCAGYMTPSNTNVCYDFKNITITNVVGSLNASYTYTINSSGQVIFTNTSTGGSNSADYWTFYDDSIHAYVASGYSITPNFTLVPNHNYIVTLYLSDNQTCSSFFTDTLYFNAILGVNNPINNNTQISIYPNPTTGNFTIQTNTTTKQTLLVFDITGKLVLTQIIQTTPNPSKEGNSNDVDASSLPAGIYNISIVSNDGVANKRLVIIK